MNNPCVSIIVVLWNQVFYTKKCFETLFRYTDIDYELIIYNNDSTDGTKHYLETIANYRDEFCKNIKIFNCKENLGFLTRVNLGFKEAKGEYILLLNNDTEMTPNWLSKMILCAESDHNIGIVNPLFNNSFSRHFEFQPPTHMTPNQVNAILESSSMKLYPDVCTCVGFCFLIKRKVYEKIGVLDEEFGFALGEESDYCMRANEAGFRTVCCDDTYVYHIGKVSFDAHPSRVKLENDAMKLFLNKWFKPWKKNVDECDRKDLLNYVRDLFKEYKFEKQDVDIIIPVHNYEKAKLCIDSILENTYVNYNLIIIDNSLNEEFRDDIQKLDNVYLIFNHDNMGFAYSVNQGIHASVSDFVLLLNDDTIVSHKWLKRLLAISRANPNIGILGPVTNSIGNEEQRVEYSFTDQANHINNYAEKLYNKSPAHIKHVHGITGFCMLMKRDVINEIGVFDTRFEIGNFEDNDFCCRAVEVGFDIYVAKSVFIFHYGGSSFSNDLFNKTMRRNEELFNEKWSEDKLESLRYRKKKKKYSITYFLASDVPCGGIKIAFEYINRLKERGYDVNVVCASRTVEKLWFDLHVPIHYTSNFDNVPQTDVSIGTFFTTLQYLPKNNSALQVHFSQGYEALTVKDSVLQSQIKGAYLIPNHKIATSNFVSNIIKKETGKTSEVIHNGIDNYIFNNHNYKIRNDVKRILVVGDQTHWIKNVEETLKVLLKLQPQFNFEIARLSPIKQSDKNIKTEYYCMSLLKQHEIVEIYKSCDIVINNPLKVEGFSLPPLEAMACGVPVITSNCGGVMDYAINNDNCIVIDEKSPDQLYDAIIKLISDYGLRKQLSESGINTANNFKWYKQIDKLENLLPILHKKSKQDKINTVSLCMIVKNEEKVLERCLQSVEDFVDEMIIVDTGSVDDTVNIAKNFGAKVYYYDWDDNFANARNMSLKKATSNWIFVLDADEFLLKDDISEIEEKMKQAKFCYNFITRNYSNNIKIEGAILNDNKYAEMSKYKVWSPSVKVRLFPNDKRIKFSGEVHEVVEPSINQHRDLKISNIDVPVLHILHEKHKNDAQKDLFYLKLAKKKAKNKSAKSLLELGNQYLKMHDYDNALLTFRRASKLYPNDSMIKAHMGTVYNLLGQYNVAIKIFSEALDLNNKNEYAIKHMGICWAKQNNFERAYSMFVKIYKNNMSDIKLLCDLAFCCNKLQKFDESIILMEYVSQFDKDTVKSTGLLEVAYLGHGVELAKKNKLERAIELFQKALSINPNCGEAHTNIVQAKKILSMR